MRTELKRTHNFFKTIGTVYELDLKKEPCDIKQFREGREVGVKKGECIKGSVAIKTEGGVQTFNIYFSSLGMDGKPSRQWSMAQKMMDWNPQINGNGNEPTVVNLQGKVEPNDYVGQDGKVHSVLRWRVNSASTRNIEDVHSTTLIATLYIYSIKPEIRNEEETGRLVLTLYGADNKGKCIPITAYVEEDMTEDFMDAYEVGMTVPFEFDLNYRQVGRAPTKKKFGRASRLEVNTGYSVEELVVSNGEDEILEPEEKEYEDEDGNIVPVKTEWIDPDVMKAAIKERELYLAELENKETGHTKTAKVKASLRDKKEAMRRSKISKKHEPEPEADENEEDFDDFDNDEEEPW